MPRSRAPIERPEGLVYRPEFLTPEEEVDALAVIEPLDFKSVEMRGQTARRTVRHFGLDYDYTSARTSPTDALPAELGWLRDRCATLLGVPPGELPQILVARYPPGAGIGWHRDARSFGEVVGVSLLGSARMRFQSGVGDQRKVFELELAPRSAYVLSGEARWDWQHSIPPGKEPRYSITFRTLQPPKAARGGGTSRRKTAESSRGSPAPGSPAASRRSR